MWPVSLMRSTVAASAGGDANKANTTATAAPPTLAAAGAGDGDLPTAGEAREGLAAAAVDGRLKRGAMKPQMM